MRVTGKFYKLHGKLKSSAVKGKLPCQSELDLFEPHLRQVVDQHHPLVILAGIFPWEILEKEYSILYSKKGAPAKPVRLMAGLLILKEIFSASDKGIMVEWSKDPFFQYFCGSSVFSVKLPCAPYDMTRFRKRIGMERLAGLKKTSSVYLKKSGIHRLKTEGKPGNENFSYYVSSGMHQIIIKRLRDLAEKFYGKSQFHAGTFNRHD